MKSRIISAIILLLFAYGTAYTQNVYLISGTVYDSTNHEPLTGATVGIRGTGRGTVTDEAGFFSLKAAEKIPFTLVISAVGYKPQEFIVSDDAGNTIAVSLHPQQLVIDQVVVSASRRPGSFLKSPVTIEKLDIKAIRESPAPTFYDALENLKGVQMTTLSLGYKVPNTRGFSGTTNSRFLQMVDGVDNISPGIGAPVANAVGPTELDIESVELIPGASSALYGLNAVNGISNMKTKSPFKYPGLSVYQKVGVNHVGAPDGASPLTETAVRYAKVIGEKFAFKINAAYMQGNDWIADNQRDQNPSANTSVGLTGADNPGKDFVNTYGDEGSNRKTLSLNGKKYIVSRTGYREQDIADYDLENFKLDASLHYKIAKNNELSYTYRIGNVTNLYQRGNRIQLDGLQIQQHALELKGKRHYLKGYYTREHTGNSYNLRPLGENMDRAFKTNDVWFADYQSAYLNAVSQGQDDAAAHRAARTSADRGRFEPGTEAFRQKKDELIRINNWDTGAALIMNTGFVHTEGQYDWSDFTPGFEVLTGYNYRNYIIHPDGNSYVNPASYTEAGRKDEVFNYYSYGGFVQVTRKLLRERLKLIGSARVDKVQYFDPAVNPRIAAVYTLAGRHNFRVSYQNGYRFPTLFEGFSYVDNGGVKRLGGLRVMSEYFGIRDNSYIRASQDQFISAVNEDINRNGLSQVDAIRKNRDVLRKSNYDYIRPEHINSFEAGYKGTWLGGKLFVDLDYYFNVYRDFIGQVELTKPNEGMIGVDDSAIFYAYDKSKTTIYRLWTNSTSIVSNQGASLGLTYNFYRKFNFTGNTAYATLVKIADADALIPAFNTPEWMVNLSVGNSEVVKHTGFNIGWRWQSAFEWQSPLANGKIPAYSVTDVQVTYRIPEISTVFKLGASNVFNKKYYQYEGGPVIGGLYYFTIIFDSNFKRS